MVFFSVVFLPLCLMSGAFGAWSYGNVTAWPGACGIGKAQSPIDITPAAAVATNEPVPLSYNYTSANQTWKLTNNGHALQIATVDGSVPSVNFVLTGGGLAGEYMLVQVHLHWGSNSSQGSEHLINGKAAAAEAHFVHIKEKFASVTAALDSKEPDAIAVLGVLYEATNQTSNTGLEPLLDSPALQNVTYPANIAFPVSVNMTNVFPSTGGFYRYNGSLTTPDCFEAVAWTVFVEPLKISEENLEKLRKLYEFAQTEIPNEHIENNFRPPQPLNNRTVQFHNSALVVTDLARTSDPGNGTGSGNNTSGATSVGAYSFSRTILAVIVLAWCQLGLF